MAGDRVPPREPRGQGGGATERGEKALGRSRERPEEQASRGQRARSPEVPEPPPWGPPLDVPPVGLSRKLDEARRVQQVSVRQRLQLYDGHAVFPRPEDKTYGTRGGYEFHLRARMLRSLRVQIERVAKRRVVPPICVVAVMAVHIASEQRLSRLRHALRSIAAQQLPSPADAEFLLALSWHATTPELAAGVEAVLLEDLCPAFAPPRTLSDAGDRTRPVLVPAAADVARQRGSGVEEGWRANPSVCPSCRRWRCQGSRRGRTCTSSAREESPPPSGPPWPDDPAPSGSSGRRQREGVEPRCVTPGCPPVLPAEQTSGSSPSCSSSSSRGRGATTGRKPELVLINQEVRHSQFQHIRAALGGAEARLREMWNFRPGDEENHSVWVMFGDDDDLWHPRRAAEFVHAVREHPLLDGVAAFATLARVNIEREELREADQMPHTSEEVDAFLGDGRATVVADDDESRVWRRRLEESGPIGSATLPVPDGLALEYFDFYPRLRLLREFFEVTARAVVANRFCDLCLDEFLTKYPLMGREAGLAVAFFEPQHWMYFYAHKGLSPEEWSKAAAEGPGDEGASAGVADGHVSSDVPVGDREREFAARLCADFQAYDPQLTPGKLARYLAHFRYGVEVCLVRTHNQVMDQREFDTAIVEVSLSAFGHFTCKLEGGRMPVNPLASNDGWGLMYRTLREFAKGMLPQFEVTVLWHNSAELMTRARAAASSGLEPSAAEAEAEAVGEAGRRQSQETYREAVAAAELAQSGQEAIRESFLDQWERSAAVSCVMRHFALEVVLNEEQHLTFRGAALLLKAMGYGLADLLEVFAVADPTADPDGQLLEIFSCMALRGAQEWMTLADIFMVIQALGIDWRDVVAVLSGDGGGHVDFADIDVMAYAEMLLRAFFEGAWVQDLAVGAGATEAVALHEVVRLLSIFGIGRRELVEAFGGAPVAERAPEDQAVMSLQMFMVQRQGTMRFRDMYELLEMMGVRLPVFLSKFAGSWFLPMQLEDLDRKQTIGDFRVRHAVSSGLTGASIYLADHITQGYSAMVKWPARDQEADALRALSFRLPDPCGLPRLLGAGVHLGKPYVVTELLGSTLYQVLQRLEGHPAARRWVAARVVGRLLLRRLEALHKCGFIHGDVSPHNVLLGPRLPLRRPCQDEERAARYLEPAWVAGGATGCTLHLVDLGCARRFPGGGEAAGDEGSMEYSSARSAAGGPRGPGDDLEALAWLLVAAVCGDLPWFPLLAEYYQVKSSLKEFKRGKLLERLGAMKRQLLEKGAGAFGEQLEHLQDMPADLADLLRACRAPEPCGCGLEPGPGGRSRSPGSAGGGEPDDEPPPREEEEEEEESFPPPHASCSACRPDYARLRQLLGGTVQLRSAGTAGQEEAQIDDEDAEVEDCLDFEALVQPLL